MSAVENLRKVINERLNAAVEEILGVCEHTIVVYEEKIVRQRRLLDFLLKPDIKLHRIGMSLRSFCIFYIIVTCIKPNKRYNSDICKMNLTYRV